MSEPARFRWAWMCLAYFSLALGIIGIFVPVMPTSPFVIVAALAAARGSKRMQFRLLRDKRFGHMIRDWYRYGAVKRSAKWLTTIAMSVSAAGMLWFSPDPVLPLIVIGIMLVVDVWLWLRPEPPQRQGKSRS
ncbi:MAG: YbaN family protein [Rhodanobacteraceae bacterium]